MIEVDGDTHAETVEYDRARTICMRDEGLNVIRFSNADVIGNLDGGLAKISCSLREKNGARAAKPRGKDAGDTHVMGDPA